MSPISARIDQTPSPPEVASPPFESSGAEPADRRLPFWLGAALTLLICAALTDRALWQPGRVLGFHENVQIGEAQAWWRGRLDLAERLYDTALKDGRAYSYFPPMFTIVAAAIVPFFDGVPHLAIVAIVAVVVFLSYQLMFRLTASAAWSVALTLGFICGTSAWPVLDRAMRGAPAYHVNHALSMIGMLLLLTEYFGRRRVWPGVLGLAMTAFSRQLTVVFALPLLYMAYHPATQADRWKRVGMAVTGCLLIGVIYLGLNALKFGDPLTTGYMLNHEGRDDIFAREARAHGTLSLHWIPRNLYYANVGLPQLHSIESADEKKSFLRPNTMGTGIWWTSPILLWLLVDARRLIHDRERLPVLVAAVALFGLLMLWHATGADQRGYNRYSLDYMPALFALIAPACLARSRRYLTCAMLAWGIAYFVWILPIPHLRVW